MIGTGIALLYLGRHHKNSPMHRSVTKYEPMPEKIKGKKLKGGRKKKMRDYLEGWKDERECEIPPIRKAGFKEEVLIRSQVPLKRTRKEMRDVKKNFNNY